MRVVGLSLHCVCRHKGCVGIVLDLIKGNTGRGLKQLSPEFTEMKGRVHSAICTGSGTWDKQVLFCP